MSSKLSACEDVALTTDILWSDRKMRSFLGVAVHIIEINHKDETLDLQSYTSSAVIESKVHTPVKKISASFEAVAEEYKIKNKIDYIITDNAANMKKHSHQVSRFRGNWQ